MDQSDAHPEDAGREHAERLVALLTEALRESSDPGERRALREELIGLHRQLARESGLSGQSGDGEAAASPEEGRTPLAASEHSDGDFEDPGLTTPVGVEERVAELMRSRHSKADLDAMASDPDPVVRDFARQQLRLQSDHPLDRLGASVSRWWNQDEPAYRAMDAVNATTDSRTSSDSKQEDGQPQRLSATPPSELDTHRSNQDSSLGGDQSANPWAVTSLILGLVSIVLYEIGILPLTAVAVGVTGLVRHDPRIQSGRWMAVVGVVLGVIFSFMYLVAYGHISV